MASSTAAESAGRGAVQEDLGNLIDMALEAELGGILDGAEQHAFLQLGLQHVREQRGGALGIGEGEPPAQDLTVKVLRNGAHDAFLPLDWHCLRQEREALP